MTMFWKSIGLSVRAIIITLINLFLDVVPRPSSPPKGHRQEPYQRPESAILGDDLRCAHKGGTNSPEPVGLDSRLPCPERDKCQKMAADPCDIGDADCTVEAEEGKR
jgi:hypothetical protein